MKTTLPTEAFKTTLAKLANPPGEEPAHIGTLAILITASEFDGVTLRRTTTNADIIATAEGDATEEGSCGVDYQTLAAALGGFTHKEITLLADPAAKPPALQIQAGKSKATIQCFSPEDILPPPAAKPATAELDILSTDLDNALALAMPAASTNPAEPQFAGVCLRNQQSQTTFFAVDRRRFHLFYVGASTVQFAPEGGRDKGVLLVAATVAMLRRLFSGPETKIGLQVADGAITARGGQIYATLPLGATTPPALENVLPFTKSAKASATCNREALLRTVRTFREQLQREKDDGIARLFATTEI